MTALGGSFLRDRQGGFRCALGLQRRAEDDRFTFEDVALLDSLLLDFSDAVHDAAASRHRRASDNRPEWPDESRDAG